VLRRQKIRQPSAVSGAEVTLPPLETLSVQLSALTLVTRGMNARGVDLAPMLDRDRKTRLIDVSGVTAAVSVLDTLKVLPVPEVAVEWHLLFRFYDTVDKTILLHPTNWQWVVGQADPFTAELVANLTLRAGLSPFIPR